ncbi:putative petal formation-expressed [Helianthus debilis subsp. tardiflorus]
MKEITKVLEVKDKDDYIRFGEKALKLNKDLAIAGPLLTGLGAVGSGILASSPRSSWAMVLGVMGGTMESIEANLKERDVGKRENGEVFEMKVALQLGRSLSELRDVAASSSRKKGNILKSLEASFSNLFKI